MSNQTVYVVTTGCYSDYSIRGIFSTKAKAQEFMDAARAAGDACYFSTDFNDIEEHELNGGLRSRKHTVWQCIILLGTGAVMDDGYSQERFDIPQSSSYVAESVPAYGGKGIVRAESHKSAEHAMKLAAEARQKWLREKANKA